MAEGFIVLHALGNDEQAQVMCAIVDCTIAAKSLSRRISLMNIRSISMASTGRRYRYGSDEYPVP